MLKPCFETELEKRIKDKRRHQAFRENVLETTENRKARNQTLFFPVHVQSQLKQKYWAVQQALPYKKTGKSFVAFQF